MTHHLSCVHGYISIAMEQRRRRLRGISALMSNALARMNEALWWCKNDGFSHRSKYDWTRFSEMKTRVPCVSHRTVQAIKVAAARLSCRSLGRKTLDITGKTTPQRRAPATTERERDQAPWGSCISSVRWCASSLRSHSQTARYSQYKSDFGPSLFTPCNGLLTALPKKTQETCITHRAHGIVADDKWIDRCPLTVWVRWADATCIRCRVFSVLVCGWDGSFPKFIFFAPSWKQLTRGSPNAFVR